MQQPTDCNSRVLDGRSHRELDLDGFDCGLVVTRDGDDE